MGSKDLAISILSITAVILLVGVLLMQASPGAVYASGMTESGGDYTMTVGKLTANEELLYVVDSVQQKLGVYRYDAQRGGIILIEQHSLKEMRGAAGSGKGAAKPNPRQPKRPGKGGRRP